MKKILSVIIALLTFLTIYVSYLLINYFHIASSNSLNISIIGPGYTRRPVTTKNPTTTTRVPTTTLKTTTRVPTTTSIPTTTLIPSTTPLCPPGSVYGSNNCLQCSAGTYANLNQNICQDCEPGTYSNSAASVCTKCAPGLISGFGANKCNSCSSGYIANQDQTDCIIDFSNWTPFQSIPIENYLLNVNDLKKLAQNSNIDNAIPIITIYPMFINGFVGDSSNIVPSLYSNNYGLTDSSNILQLSFSNENGNTPVNIRAVINIYEKNQLEGKSLKFWYPNGTFNSIKLYRLYNITKTGNDIIATSEIMNDEGLRNNNYHITDMNYIINNNPTLSYILCGHVNILKNISTTPL